MIKEIQTRLLDDEVARSILNLADREEALVLRANKTEVPSKEQWEGFLINVCGLTLDPRQYTYTENLVEETWWEISNQPDLASSYAYSTTRQPFHTDNAWFPDPAQINFFIMQRQAKAGGNQLIYPVSRLIDDLHRMERALLDDLSSIPVTIKKGNSEYANTTTVIDLKDGGRVYWNYYRTEKTDSNIAEMCDRFFEFLKMREASKSVDEIRCESGDCLAFNDQKILHARTEFAATEPRERILLQSMWRLPR